MSHRTRWDVLLAEDNDDHALLIKMAIERASRLPVELRRARNGDEAIQLLEAAAPDLLLLDLKMPGRSGHEVLEKVKSDERLRSIPVAVLTSSDRDEDVAKSYGLGGNHFITKPENPADLEAKLRSLLNNLGELRGIRRGTTGIEPTARSAIQASSFAMRRALMWGMAAALLIALVLYVNEIPDRRGDARAGKRTLPVRFSREVIVGGYRAVALVAYAVLLLGVLIGVLPLPALLMLLTVPLALQVERGLRPNYDNPYGLMAVMGVNIKLHLYAGLRLVAAVVAVLVLLALAPGVPLFVGR